MADGIRVTLTLVRTWSRRQHPATIGKVAGSASSNHRAACAVTSDRELITRLAAGDDSALAEIYRLHAGLVFGLARRVLGDTALAEDVTQDVFVYLWQQPARFDPQRGTLRSWLGLLTHRRSVDRIRAETRRVAAEERRNRAEPQIEEASVADDQLALVWLAVRVQEALGQLPHEQRECVELAYYGGRTYREVAAELHIPEGTAKSRLRLALAKLNELLRPTITDKDAPAWI
jgi:RNA polymerase sigma-70 factor (ECF subfamily)